MIRPKVGTIWRQAFGFCEFVAKCGCRHPQKLVLRYAPCVSRGRFARYQTEGVAIRSTRRDAGVMEDWSHWDTTWSALIIDDDPGVRQSLRTVPGGRRSPRDHGRDLRGRPGSTRPKLVRRGVPGLVASVGIGPYRVARDSASTISPSAGRLFTSSGVLLAHAGGAAKPPTTKLPPSNSR